MPSKALLRPGELLARDPSGCPACARWSPGARPEAGPRPPRRGDPRPRRLAAWIPWLEERGIELFRGRGALDGERTRARRRPSGCARARAVVIATGTDRRASRRSTASPRRARGRTARRRPPSRCPSGCWSSAAAWSGSRWRRRGAASARASRLVEALDRVLAGEEPFASEQVDRRRSSDGGVEVRTGVKATAASRGEGGQVTLRARGRRRAARRRAPGRGRPPAAHRRARARDRRGRGRRLPRGRRPAARRRLGLAVRDRRRQRALAAHAHGQVPGADLRRRDPRQGRARPRADKAGSPRVVFTDPQVAAVGLTLAAARGATGSRRARSTSRPRPTPARASSGATRPAPRGSSSTTEREVIVGATFVGPEIAESLHAATIAVAAEVPLERARPRGAGVPDPQRGLALPARGYGC